MKKFLTYTMILLPVIFLGGCSYFSKPSFIKSKDQAYLSARSIPPLKAPPGINTSDFQNVYPVSNRLYPMAPGKADLTPPGLNNH